jgi:hypothetical protein
LLLFNTDHLKAIKYTLPPPASGHPWRLLFDTSHADADQSFVAGPNFELQPCSIAAFCDGEPMQSVAPVVAKGRKKAAPKTAPAKPKKKL